MTLTLAALPTWTAAVGIVFFLAICISLILIVLIQRPQGGGLGGAFGGGAAGSGQTAFGARTGDVLTWSTISIFVIFLTIASLLNFVVLPPSAQIAPSVSPTSAPGAKPASDTKTDADAAPATPTDADATQPSAPPQTEPTSADAPQGQTDSGDSTPASTPPPPAPAPSESPNPNQGESGGGAL